MVRPLIVRERSTWSNCTVTVERLKALEDRWGVHLSEELLATRVFSALREASQVHVMAQPGIFTRPF